MGGSRGNKNIVTGAAPGLPAPSIPGDTAPLPPAQPLPGVASTYAPAPMTQPAGPSVWDQSAGAYAGALAGTQGAMAGPNMAQFQNPWQQQVFDASMGQMDRARQMAMNDVGAQATRAGAFGGSRHGVAEAETNRGFADQIGNLSANLNMQGFNTALNAGQQQQQAQMAGAGQLGTLSNLGFGFGQQLTNNQLTQGAQQQQIQQQLIDAMKGQYGGFTGAPRSGTELLASILSGTPYSQTQTTKESPGILGILGAGLSLL